MNKSKSGGLVSQNLEPSFKQALSHYLLVYFKA